MHTLPKTMTLSMPSKPSARWIGFSLLFLLGAAGCGQTTTVTGKVSYQGDPLTSGTVIFVTADNQTFRGPIDKTGNYSVADVPLGPARVTVESPPPGANKPPVSLTQPKKSDLPPAIEETPPIAPSHWRRIPKEYSLPNQSGLSHTVSNEANVYNIDLK